MSVDRITEILAHHADLLNSERLPERETFLADYPDQREELAPLLEIAARVKRTLVPVRPTPTFRKRLHDGLIMAATHQQAHRILIEKKDEPQWGWLLGAAALGSAAGLVALVWRARSREHKPISGIIGESDDTRLAA